jgi:hypothetical protein
MLYASARMAPLENDDLDRADTFVADWTEYPVRAVIPGGLSPRLMLEPQTTVGLRCGCLLSVTTCPRTALP